MAEPIITAEIPFGFDCLSCPYAVKLPTLGAHQRQCRGMPPVMTLSGADQRTGQPTYLPFYRVVVKGDWCGQHPQIRARAEPFSLPSMGSRA
jgi:hypothetical protein